MRNERGTTAIDVPPGFWQREASHYPRPLTPLGSSLLLTGINQAFPKVFAEFGLLLETLELREIGGYVYQRVKPFGVSGSGSRTLPPKAAVWLMLRLHPSFRRRIARCKEAMRSGLDRSLIDRWYEEWRPQLTADIGRWRSVDLTALSDEELAAHLGKLREWTFDAIDVHFFLSAASLSLVRLAFFCRDHLGYDDRQTLGLLSGLSEASSEPALELAKLADEARADGRLTEAILAVEDIEVPSLLAERHPELARKFDEYLYRYGCRALRYELVEECLSERPELVAELLRDELRRPTDLKTEQERLAVARAQAKAAALTALENETLGTEFLALLTEAERAYPVREDNEFYTVSVPLALVRFAALEAGKRLATNGVLAAADDLFFLHYDEAIAALSDRGGDHKELVARRREDFAASEAFDPPASYGQEPPTPPLDVLPPEARFVMEGVTYFMERVFEPERSNRRQEAGVRELRGIAASKGTFTGPARIILGEGQFDKLRPGDVLVCPVTSPVWSVLFAKVGALVTDSGGVLSHPAIIAREYGIPAVVATGNATEVIADGQQIVVDGEAGLVRLQE
jgi:pyruvate,water dikinase